MSNAAGMPPTPLPPDTRTELVRLLRVACERRRWFDRDYRGVGNPAQSHWNALREATERALALVEHRQEEDHGRA
jgi:hypothetical protein